MPHYGPILKPPRKNVPRLATFVGYIKRHGQKMPLSVFWERTDSSGLSCWVHYGPKRGSRGYMAFGAEYAHRFSWILHFGEIPAGFLVCHTCDNPQCVNPDHLFLGRHIDNMMDCKSKGRFASGNQNGSRLHPDRVQRGTKRYNTSLNNQDVQRIRDLYTSGVKNKEICQQYGITHSTVCAIINRKTWRHVQ